MKAEFSKWLEGRPEIIHKTAAEFPPGTTLDLNGVTLYLVGYTEDGDLEMSPVNPVTHYELAMATRTTICAKHMREHGVKVTLSALQPGGDGHAH
jgi:hypothetical protein